MKVGSEQVYQRFGHYQVWIIPSLLTTGYVVYVLKTKSANMDTREIYLKLTSSKYL
jgi:hypothetical protein